MIEGQEVMEELIRLLSDEGQAILAHTRMGVFFNCPASDIILQLFFF
jgi:hypothetical protein